MAEPTPVQEALEYLESMPPQWRKAALKVVRYGNEDDLYRLEEVIAEARGWFGELVDEVERKLSARNQQIIDGVYADKLIHDSAAEGDGEP